MAGVEQQGRSGGIPEALGYFQTFPHLCSSQLASPASLPLAPGGICTSPSLWGFVSRQAWQEGWGDAGKGTRVWVDFQSPARRANCGLKSDQAALPYTRYWFNVYPSAATLSTSQAGLCTAQDPISV